MDIPEVIPSTRDIDPMSIPELFPEDEDISRTDNTLSPAGGGVRRGGRGWNTQHGNPQSPITTHKIIINTPENEQNDLPRRDGGTKDDDDPGFPPGLLANPFFKQPDPSLKGKINPMAFTRPTARKEYTRQEIEEMLAKEWEKTMNDPNSAFNDPDSEYYIPPENRDPENHNPALP